MEVRMSGDAVPSEKAPITEAAAWHRPADLGERRRAEQKVRRVNRQVEQRVLERTRELEDTTQELAAFVNSVSHDLRAPVRGLIGLTEILATDHAQELSPEANSTLGMTAEQAQKLDRTISAFLALSRVGRRRLELQVVDIEALVRDVASQLEWPGLRASALAWTATEGSRRASGFLGGLGCSSGARCCRARKPDAC